MDQATGRRSSGMASELDDAITGIVTDAAYAAVPCPSRESGRRLRRREAADEAAADRSYESRRCSWPRIGRACARYALHGVGRDCITGASLADGPSAGSGLQRAAKVSRASMKPYTSRCVPGAESFQCSQAPLEVQDGKLRLSMAQVVAAVVQNNLTVAAARYYPAAAQTDLLRARSGQSPRGVDHSAIPSGVFAGARAAASWERGRRRRRRLERGRHHRVGARAVNMGPSGRVRSHPQRELQPGPHLQSAEHPGGRRRAVGDQRHTAATSVQLRRRPSPPAPASRLPTAISGRPPRNCTCCSIPTSRPASPPP